MKKVLITLLSIVIAFSLAGCDKKVIIEPTKNNKKEETKLEEGEYSVSLNDSINIGKDMTINLYDVDDSRCPINVECYWQGELAYSISINGEYNKISTVTSPKITYKNYTLKIVPSKCDETTLVFEVKKAK